MLRSVALLRVLRSCSGKNINLDKIVRVFLSFTTVFLESCVPNKATLCARRNFVCSRTVTLLQAESATPLAWGVVL